MTSSPILAARSQYLLDLLAQVPDPRKRKGRRHSLAGLLAVLRPCFTGPSFRTFCGLAAGLCGQVRRRTVCGMLLGAGLSRRWPHDRAHYFFARAAWQLDELVHQRPFTFGIGAVVLGQRDGQHPRLGRLPDVGLEQAGQRQAGAGHPGDVAGELGDRDLHAEADAEVGHTLLARDLRGEDLALDAAAAEAASAEGRPRPNAVCHLLHTGRQFGGDPFRLSLTEVAGGDRRVEAFLRLGDHRGDEAVDRILVANPARLYAISGAGPAA